MDTAKTINIAGKAIGEGHQPVIVAEMSGNHNQSLDRALKIVDAVASSGAQMIKLQTYTADTITLDVDEGEFFINNLIAVRTHKILSNEQDFEVRLGIRGKCTVFKK